MRRFLLAMMAVLWSTGVAAAQPLGPREDFMPALLPSPGMLRLANASPTLAEGPIVEGQVFLSIPVRHTIAGMSSAGRYVDVVYRRGRPRGQPDRPSRTLPTPAPFYLTVLSDTRSGTPQFWWCTPGEGLRLGPMCTGGGLGAGVSNGRSSVGVDMVEHSVNPYLPRGLAYLVCTGVCSQAWMHHFTIRLDNQPVRADLSLEYALGVTNADGTRTVERRLGGKPLDLVQVNRGAELLTVVGAISLASEGGGVRATARSYSERERSGSLAVFDASFRGLMKRYETTLGEPNVVAAAGDPTGIGADTPVLPMTQVFSQPVTLPGSTMPFPEGQSPELFIDYLGAVGDTWDVEHGEFRPRYAWFAFGYARFSSGRWYVLVPVDASSGGDLVLAGQRLLKVIEIDGNGIAKMQLTGRVPVESTALR